MAETSLAGGRGTAAFLFVYFTGKDLVRLASRWRGRSLMGQGLAGDWGLASLTGGGGDYVSNHLADDS